MTIPETSSEKPLEHSEIDNSKNSFFCYSDVCTKNKNYPNQNQNENWTIHLIFTNLTIQESIAKIEWDNTKVPEVSGQQPKDLAYQVNEMQVQKSENGIFVGDSAATSHMTSEMIGCTTFRTYPVLS